MGSIHWVPIVKYQIFNELLVIFLFFYLILFLFRAKPEMYLFYKHVLLSLSTIMSNRRSVPNISYVYLFSRSKLDLVDIL